MSKELIELLRKARSYVSVAAMEGHKPAADLVDRMTEALAQPAQADERDGPELCPACGAEDGGTTCGMPNCGLLMGEPAQAALTDADMERLWDEARDQGGGTWTFGRLVEKEAMRLAQPAQAVPLYKPCVVIGRDGCVESVTIQDYAGRPFTVIATPGQEWPEPPAAPEGKG